MSSPAFTDMMFRATVSAACVMVVCFVLAALTSRFWDKPTYKYPPLGSYPKDIVLKIDGPITIVWSRTVLCKEWPTPPQEKRDER